MIEELLTINTGAKALQEGNIDYILLPSQLLPDGCDPASTDALLRPGLVDGYNSRLYFARQIKPAGNVALNWNANSVVILQRSWFAFSWRTPSGLSLAQMLAIHLKALR